MFKIFKFFLILEVVIGIPIKTRCKVKSELKNKNLVIYKNKRLDNIENTDLLIDLRFIVLHNNIEGKVTEKELNDQIDVLNDAFSGNYEDSEMIDSEMRFRIFDIKYINNNGYFSNCDSNDLDIMRKFNRKNDRLINVYLCKSDSYLGWAYYPWTFQETMKENGIFLHFETLPNRGMEFYNSGLTLVHELGHYFGLLHTFDVNGVCEDGDLINDTPVEKTPSFSCDYKRDSCPNHKGLDPINNYMDYSPDSCLNEFTKQQVRRMHDTINQYKPLLKYFSINNFKKNFIKDKIFYKVGNGICVNNDNTKLETYRFLKFGKFISKKECEQKTRKYLGIAFTFTYKKHMAKLKYNCLIHYFKKQEDIDNIENDENINKGRYKNSECFKIKI